MGDPLYITYLYSITDIDECATSNGMCHANATCANTVGSNKCTCKPGFNGNGTHCIGKQLCCFIIVFIYFVCMILSFTSYYPFHYR